MSAVLARRDEDDDAPDAALGLDELCRLFATVLECGAVGPDDDFFEIGGSSMAAISLILEIERRTGLELSVQAIYNSPTPRGMAALLGGGDELADASSTIVLRGGAARHALFLVHGVGGSAIELRDLARQLGPDLRVYGIQASGFDGTSPDRTVEAMARRYADEVARLRPSGPILLAGYSSGGLVAFEMARHLAARGRRVGFLGMIDTYPDPGLSVSRFWLHARIMLRVPAGARRATLARRLRNLRLRLRVRFGLETRISDPDAAMPDAVLRVRHAIEVAEKRYRPTAQACEVAFFRASHISPLFDFDPARVWRPLVRNLTVDVVPGDHYTLIGTRSADLAAAISKRLAPVVDAA